MAMKVFTGPDLGAGACKMSFPDAATVRLEGSKTKAASDVIVGDVLSNPLGFNMPVISIENVA